MADLDELIDKVKSRLWMRRYRYHFTNERKIPHSVLNLLNVPNLPENLREAITQARKELKETGAVSYPTASRVEHYLRQYQSPDKGGRSKTTKP
jgi:hypothetical protein